MQNRYETNRVTIKKFELSDVRSFATLFNDPELNRLSGLKLPESQPEKLVALSMLIEQKSSQFYVLREKNTQQLIGLIVFYRIYLRNYLYSKMDCEIGFALKRDYWGQGIMGAAAESLVRAYFEETDFLGLYAGTSPTNQRSQALLRRLKFQPASVAPNLAPDQFGAGLDYFYLNQSHFGDGI